MLNLPLQFPHSAVGLYYHSYPYTSSFCTLLSPLAYGFLHCHNRALLGYTKLDYVVQSEIRGRSRHSVASINRGKKKVSCEPNCHNRFKLLRNHTSSDLSSKWFTPALTAPTISNVQITWYKSNAIPAVIRINPESQVFRHFKLQPTYIRFLYVPNTNSFWAN